MLTMPFVKILLQYCVNLLFKKIKVLFLSTLTGRTILVITMGPIVAQVWVQLTYYNSVVTMVTKLNPS
jgi:hypothetical protein